MKKIISAPLLAMLALVMLLPVAGRVNAGSTHQLTLTQGNPLPGGGGHFTLRQGNPLPGGGGHFTLTQGNPLPGGGGH